MRYHQERDDDAESAGHNRQVERHPVMDVWVRDVVRVPGARKGPKKGEMAAVRVAGGVNVVAWAGGRSG